MPPTTNTQSDQMRQIIERLGQANNVLITVSDSPSVDQLAACIGLTLSLNKQGKHATAVFSGKVPSTLEFLQPERTIETNTNSLRDFIISLDKSKADKLRYKVEDDFVKIFITPYRTSIDEKDLAFTQGDFNIDLIITLGVHERAHLDAAIIAHGRILHDATVVSMNTDTVSEIGAINWIDTDASSLCEMASDLVTELDKNIFDTQIATALLTGMVAETDRFGNEKARPHTMSVSGVLMAAGASPQLISNKLHEPEPEPEPAPEPEEPAAEIPEVVENAEPQQEAEAEAVSEPEPEPEPPKNNDGMIQIDHSDDDILIDEHGKLQAVKELEDAQAALEAETKSAPEPETVEQSQAQEDQPAQPEQPDPQEQAQPEEQARPDGRIMYDPPQLGGQLTANSIAEHEQSSPSTDPMSNAAPNTPMLERTQRQQIQKSTMPPEPPSEDQTLEDIERAVASQHLQDQPVNGPDDQPNQPDQPVQPDPPQEAGAVPPPPPVDDARAAVEEAVEHDDTYRPEPIDALGATPLDLNLGHNPSDAAAPATQDNDDAHDDNQSPPDDNNNGPTNTPPPVPPPLVPPGM